MLWCGQRDLGNILRAAKAFYGPAMRPYSLESTRNTQISPIGQDWEKTERDIWGNLLSFICFQNINRA